MRSKLYAFDFIVIVCGNRFCEIDWEIAKRAEKYSVPFAFVRSKSDTDLLTKSESDKLPVADVKISLRDKIKESLVKDMPMELKLARPKLFVISSKVFSHPDIYRDYKLDEDEMLNYIREMVSNRRN